jgi:hypothetical protein
MRLSYDTPISFRFTRDELSKLDKLVEWEKEKGPVMQPRMQANRTTVLKALIERELLRLADEQAKIAEKLAKAKKASPPPANGSNLFDETPGQRKTRLQRERRARDRGLGAVA